MKVNMITSPMIRFKRISLMVVFAFGMLSIPHLGNAQQPKTETYLLTLRLSPAFTDYLGRPGVIDEVDASRRER